MVTTIKEDSSSENREVSSGHFVVCPPPTSLSAAAADQIRPAALWPPVHTAAGCYVEMPSPTITAAGSFLLN